MRVKVIDPDVHARRSETVVAPVMLHDEIVFDSTSVAANVPVCTVNVSFAAESVKLAVLATFWVMTGASFAAVIDTVNVAVVVYVPSVTLTVNVSLAFVARALITDAVGKKAYSPVAFVTVRVPYVPAFETVEPLSVPVEIP